MSDVRIVIADDHELVRAGLIKVLREAHPEWEIVGEAADGREAVRLSERFNPNVAILDLSMPELTGLQVTEVLRSTIPGIKILILTVHTAEPVMRQIRRAGAAGFLAKDEAPASLVRYIEKMVAGDPFVVSVSASRKPSELSPHDRVPMQYLLTPRELEVVRLLAQGMSNKEIGPALDVSVRTVESHRADIFARLGVDSLGELVGLAVRDGLA